MASQIGIDRIPAIIVSGTALSPQIDIGAKTLVGIAMPAAWTAAALSVQVSIDGGVNWLEFNSGGVALSLTVAAGQFVAIDPTLWFGINSIRLRSGALGAVVNQGQDSVLTLILR